MHMELIPLKTPQGELIGHARVKDGFVAWKLKSPAHGSAVVLTGAGSVSGAAEGRIQVSSPVLAAAIHDGGRLLCYGIAKGSGMDIEDIRRRLPAQAQATAPARPAQQREKPDPISEYQAFVAAETERERAEETLCEPTAEMKQGPRPQPGAAAAQPLPEREAAERKHSASSPSGREKVLPERGAPGKAARPGVVPEGAEPEAVRAMEIGNFSAVDTERPPLHPAGREEPEAFQAAGAAPVRAMEKAAVAAFEAAQEMEDPLPTSEDTAREAEAFFALINRADRVYRQAVEPLSPPIAPEPAQPNRSAAHIRNWHEEVDAFLELSGERVRSGVPNPFPHIFPNAAFTRIQQNGVTERLEGDWRRGAERFYIHAVPGSYSPAPPAHLPGYTRYIRSRAGGFWVKVTEQ